MCRIADHSISTSRMSAEATAETFFNSPLLGTMVCEFFESHKKTGATSTGRLPMVRGARMACYLHAVFVSSSSHSASAVQNSVVVFRCYRGIWTNANRDRGAKESVQEWNLPLLQLAGQVVDAVVDHAETFWGDVVHVEQHEFSSMVKKWASETDNKTKAKLRRRIVACRCYNSFVLDCQFVLQLALKLGMRPLGFVELDWLTKSEFDHRVDRAGRRPQVESSIVELPDGNFMLSRNSGKGNRSKGAAPSERNALYQRDPVTSAPGHLAGLNFAGAKKAHRILVTDDRTGTVDRTYKCSDGSFRKSQALFTRNRNHKFVTADSKCMFAPPYLRPGNCQGIDGAPSTGEGGSLSKVFTKTIASLFRKMSMERGCKKFQRCKLKEAMTMEKLSLSTEAAAVVRRWIVKPDLELTIYDVRRALSTSVLSACDAARAWAAAGGSSHLVLAMSEIRSKHLSVANHSHQVAEQYYKQSSPIESARLYADANSVRKGLQTMDTLTQIDLSGTPAEVEAKIERMHRFVAWVSLNTLVSEGRLSWEKNGTCKFPVWQCCSVVLLFFYFVFSKWPLSSAVSSNATSLL